jgi:arylsulfatase A
MKRPGSAAAGGLLLALAACGGGGSPSASTTTPPAAVATPTPDPGPPNILFIVVDDMGYGDLGAYGNTKVKTPNIDGLAAAGARFTNFYVASPVCAPSRAAMMTGRWPPRTGIVWNPPDKLDSDEIVIAEPLRDAGYATALIGKWHLGWSTAEMPIHHGFDYFYGIANGEDENNFILGDQPTRDTVSPDQFARRYTQEALKFISAHRGQRFFVEVAHRDPHLPNQPPADYAGRSAWGTYGDTVEWLDANVGDLMKGLKDLGVDQNTLVVFTSDNGPAVGSGSTGPLHGGKGSCEEGGIRVPAIVSWPARVRGGRTITELANTVDLFPTFISAARAKLPNRHYDGVDLLRLITGEVDRIGGQGIDGGRELVFWQQYGWPGALRSGRYKYLRPGLWNTHQTLFDLETDPGELNDLAPTRPELVKQLENRLQEILAAN